MKLFNLWPFLFWQKYLLITTVCNIYIKRLCWEQYRSWTYEDCTSDRRHFLCCSCMFYLAHVAQVVTVSASWKKLHVSVKVPLLLYMDHTFFLFFLLFLILLRTVMLICSIFELFRFRKCCSVIRRYGPCFLICLLSALTVNFYWFFVYLFLASFRFVMHKAD